MEGVRLAAEDAEGIVVTYGAGEVLLRIELGVIGPDAVGKQIERQPQEEVGDQDEAAKIVQAHGIAERDHVDEPDIANLQARQDHQNEADVRWSSARCGPAGDEDRCEPWVQFLWPSVYDAFGVSPPSRGMLAVARCGGRYRPRNLKHPAQDHVPDGDAETAENGQDQQDVQRLMHSAADRIEAAHKSTEMTELSTSAVGAVAEAASVRTDQGDGHLLEGFGILRGGRCGNR